MHKLRLVLSTTCLDPGKTILILNLNIVKNSIYSRGAQVFPSAWISLIRCNSNKSGGKPHPLALHLSTFWTPSGMVIQTPP